MIEKEKGEKNQQSGVGGARFVLGESNFPFMLSFVW